MCAESLRCEPNAFDKDGNAYWYFEGSSGVLYKEGPPKPGRKAKPPEWEPISRGHEVINKSQLCISCCSLLLVNLTCTPRVLSQYFILSAGLG